MVSDASNKKAAQKKVVSVAVMAAASFNGPDKVANGIAKIQISDWTCTSLQRYSILNRTTLDRFLGRTAFVKPVFWTALLFQKTDSNRTISQNLFISGLFKNYLNRTDRMQPLKLLTNPFLGKNHSSDLVIWCRTPTDDP
ncbi:hypothetical protein HKD37_01G002294 [Glycine soja]